MRTQHVVRPRHGLPSGHDSPLVSAEVARTVDWRLRNRQFAATRRCACGTSCDLGTHRRAVGTPRSPPPRSHEVSAGVSPTDSSRPLGDAHAACRATSARARRRARRPPAERSRLPAGLRRGRTKCRLASPQPTVRDHSAPHPRHVARPQHTPADAPDGPLPSGHNSPLTSGEVARSVGLSLRNRQFVTTRRCARGMSCDLGTGCRRARRTTAERS